MGFARHLMSPLSGIEVAFFQANLISEITTCRHVNDRIASNKSRCAYLSYASNNSLVSESYLEYHIGIQNRGQHLEKRIKLYL